MKHEINLVQMREKIPPFKFESLELGSGTNETWNEFGANGCQNATPLKFEINKEKRYEQNAKWKWSKQKRLWASPNERSFHQVQMNSSMLPKFINKSEIENDDQDLNEREIDDS